MSAIERNAEAADTTRWTTTIRVAGWLVAIAAGAVQAWAGRFPVGEDGVSYLDIADAYLRGDWQNAINAYWSPMFSWLLAAALGFARPSPFFESTIVHALSFLIYLASLAAFEYFLQQVIARHVARTREAAAQHDQRLSPNVLRALAYGLYVWVTSQWITVPLETPDMVLTIFVFLATAALLRMRLQPPRIGTLVGFGVVLGLGFLTKSAMFPLSIVFLGLLLLERWRHPGAVRSVVIAGIAFAVVAGPFIAAISIAKGRLTTGDTGKLAYIWHANEALDRDRHWHAEFPDDRRPLHPTRKLLDRPALYEFGSDPIAGAYPVWYDPSYWHDGSTVRFDLAGQLRTLHWSSVVWRQLFITDGDFLVFGALTLFVVAFRRWRTEWQEALELAPLLIPLPVALGLYSIVLLSPRYVAVFALLFWVGVFAGVRLPRSPVSTRLALAIPVAILLMIGLRLAPWSVERLREARQQMDPAAHMYWQIADGLNRMGAQPGDGMVSIGYGAPAYWARLGRFRIVAEMFGEQLGFPLIPGVEHILQQDGSLTPDVMRAFAATGARFVVARRVPPEVARHGWQQLGEGTQWYGYALPR